MFVFWGNGFQFDKYVFQVWGLNLPGVLSCPFNAAWMFSLVQRLLERAGPTAIDRMMNTVWSQSADVTWRLSIAEVSLRFAGLVDSNP